MRVLLTLCLGLLAVVLTAPDAAAAALTGAEATASAIGLGVATLGAGIAVQLRAPRFNTDGERDGSHSFRLDSDADDFGDQLQAYGDAQLEAGAAPVRAELTAAQAERDEYRAIAVDEILRVQQLGVAEGEFDADEERAYLKSLPPKTLAIHFKKAREKGVKLSPQTSGEEPAPEAAELAYGHVSVA